MSEDDPHRAELGSRDDVKLEQLVEGLQRITSSLAVSLRSYKRSPGNPIFRLSVDQQYQAGLTLIPELVGLPNVIHGEAAAHLVVETYEPFLALCAEIDWLPHAADLRSAFQVCADAVAGRTGADAPCLEWLTFVGRRADLPQPPAPAEAPRATPAAATEADAAEPRASNAPTPAPAPVAVASTDAPLHESAFTYGPDHAYRALLGAMYVTFLVHVKGMSQADALQRVSPAALMGFDRSIEQALGDYRGTVVFRIVRQADGVKVQLQRVAGPAAEPGPPPMERRRDLGPAERGGERSERPGGMGA